MSTILKHIGLQRKGDEGDHKVSEGLEDEHIEVKRRDEDVLEKKVDIGLEEPIDVVDDEDVIEIEPFLTQRPHVRPPVGSVQVFTYQPHSQLYLNGLDINHQTSSQAIVYDPMHKILDVHLDRLRVDYASHLDALFLFIRLKIKAMIPSSRTSQCDTIFMVCNRLVTLSHFSFKWPYTKNVLKRIARLMDEEYRLVDYVVGSKVDFQDPWASVDYVYSPFNVHGNHWVLLCLDLVSCQVKVWDSLTYNRQEMTNIFAHSTLVPKLLDSRLL
ncbi:hypothetical protein IC575_021013 [Cucumis melo]